MIRRLLHDDSGAVAVMAAVLLSFAFLFLGAIVVDAGYLYDSRSQLQSAADAGALHGCWVLSETDGDVAAAETAARQAALENATGPGLGLEVTRVDVNASTWEVQVEVGSNARTFFSRRRPGGAAGPESRRVVAVARAQRQRLVGARFLVPWGLPIIENVREVRALVNGVPTVLNRTGGMTWEGDIAAASSCDVNVEVENVNGVTEIMVDDSSGKAVPSARLNVTGAGYPFTEVSLSSDYAANDALVYPMLTVRTAASQTSVSAWIDGVTRSLSPEASGTVWTYQLGPGDFSLTTADLLTVHPIDVFVGTGSRDRVVDAYFHIRRSTHPVEAVQLTPGCIPAGGTSHITVSLSAFDPETTTPGELFTLRVGSPSGLAGNYGEVNYGQIVHQPG